MHELKAPRGPQRAAAQDYAAAKIIAPRSASLNLWRSGGPALAKFRYDDFALADAKRLDDERVSAITLQLDIALADGLVQHVSSATSTIHISVAA